MTISRRYVLHGNDRVYLDDMEVLTEYECAHCGEEVLSGQMFQLHGNIINPVGARVTLHTSDGTPAYLHHEHAAGYLAGKLAEIS